MARPPFTNFLPQLSRTPCLTKRNTNEEQGGTKGTKGKGGIVVAELFGTLTTNPGNVTYGIATVIGHSSHGDSRKKYLNAQSAFSNSTPFSRL